MFAKLLTCLGNLTGSTLTRLPIGYYRLVIPVRGNIITEEEGVESDGPSLKTRPLCFTIFTNL